MGAAVLYVCEAVLLLTYHEVDNTEVFWISIVSLQRSRIMQFKLILIEYFSKLRNLSNC